MAVVPHRMVAEAEVPMGVAWVRSQIFNFKFLNFVFIKKIRMVAVEVAWAVATSQTQKRYLIKKII